MIYIYGLTPKTSPNVDVTLDDLRGIGTPPRLRAVGNWSLIWSQYEGREILPKRRDMLAHTRVLETLMAQTDVLPARFGLLADDFVSIEKLITAKAETIADTFLRTGGAVELGVRIRYPHQPALDAALHSDPKLIQQRDRLVAGGAGGHFARIDFGQALAERLDRRRGAVQARLIARLGPLARDSVLRAPETDTEVLRAEYLVAREDMQAFESAVASVAAAETATFAPGSEPDVQIVGPAPAYHFVHLSLAVPSGSDQAAA